MCTYIAILHYEPRQPAFGELPLWRSINNIPTTALPQLQYANHVRKSVYFLRKIKMADGRFLFFRHMLLG